MSSAPRQPDAAGMPASLLRDLDPGQRAAVLAPRGPVVVVAGPGTGKTRTIAHRIAYGVLREETPPRRILAVTFTRRAAGELRGRLAGLGVAGVATRTFHSAAARQLRHFWPRLIGGEMPSVLPSPRDALAAVLAEYGWTGEPGQRSLVPDVLAEIDWAKASLVAPEDYPTAARRGGRRVPGGDASRICEVFEAYERFKVRHRRIDLNDMLLLLTAGLEDDPGAARQVRDTYRHLVVDEYQDISPAQQRLVEAWLGEGDDLFVVGDPRQTIYSFAGASAEPMLAMPRRYPTATVVTLERCYRSRPEVLDLAAQIVTAGSESGDLGRALRAVRAPASPGVPAVVSVAHASAAAERRWVAARVAATTAHLEPSQVAVLVRTRELLEDYVRVLESAGVPVYARDDRGYFERDEVRAAVALLRVAARLEAGTQRAHEQDEQGTDLTTRVVDVLSGVGWSPAGPARGARARRESWYLLEALVRQAEELDSDPKASVASLVARLDAMGRDAVEPTLRAVTVATMHAAKGREWDAVFVPSLVDGVVPAARSGSGAGPEAEERRLLYVAVTRARDQLVLSWHDRPSRLLPPQLTAAAQGPDRAGAMGSVGRAGTVGAGGKRGVQKGGALRGGTRRPIA